MEAIEGYRISAQQHRVWDLLRTGGRYESTCVVRLRGPVVKERLRAAVHAVVSRHEALRTSCEALDRMEWPLQVVRPEAAFEWSVQGVAADGLQAWLAEVWAAPCGAGLEARLGVVGATERWLALRASALYADGASLQVVVEELAARYGETWQERNPLQYVQFCESQQEILTSESGEEGRRYWQRQWERAEQVEGMRPLVEAARFMPRRVHRAIPPETAAGLGLMAGDAGVDLAAIALVCWNILVWRTTGKEGHICGHHGSIRKEFEAQLLVGPGVRVQPVMQMTRGDAGVSTLARYCHRAVRLHEKRQEYCEGGIGRGGYWAVGYEHAALGRWSGGDVEFAVLSVRSGGERHDVKLLTRTAGEGLEVELEYDGARMSGAEATRWLGQYATVLSSVAAAPEARVAELEWVPAEQRQQVIETWNATTSGYPSGLCVHELFESQVAETPSAVAVSDGTRSLTYAELNGRSNRLARVLVGQGVGAETAVALCLGRSVDMVVALLAVLKAGGAYVPLDPAHPAARLQYQVADSGARVVIGDGREAASWTGSGVSWVPVSAGGEESATNLALRSGPLHLAYIIYTSGSTGNPKGVQVAHRSVVNLAYALESTVYAGSSSGVGLNAPLSFDASVKQLVQVCRGRRVVVLPEAVRRDGEALWRQARECGAAVVDCTPTQLRMSEVVGSRPGVARVVVGGESIDAALWRRLSSDAGTRYWNVYGPTECTVDATAAEVEGEAPHLGRPLSNVRVYVLDALQRVVPVGVEGELYIGGAGVARGYAGAAGLTASRFVPDRFGGESGSRLYRTGDRGAWRDDGTLEYRGRSDAQVQLRGHRVELGRWKRFWGRIPGFGRPRCRWRARARSRLWWRTGAVTSRGVAIGCRTVGRLRMRMRTRRVTCMRSW